MGNVYMKRFSSLVIRKMQIKSIISYHCIFIRMTKIKKKTPLNSGKRGKIGHTLQVGM